MNPTNHNRIRSSLTAGIEIPRGTDDRLAGLLREVLTHSGSLIRPKLMIEIAAVFGFEQDQIEPLAVAVEYFHTASLILDDLPSMDDARMRRGRTCPHLQFGEDTAVLGSLALINRAYALIWKTINGLPLAQRQDCAELVDGCLGLSGVIGGQAHDLHACPVTEAGVTAVARGKTVAMLRLALLLPAHAGGAAQATIQRLDALSEAWGLAYQATDDLMDTVLTHERSNKTPGRDDQLNRPNMVLAIGPDETFVRIDEYLRRARGLITELVADDRRWSCLDQIQQRLLENLSEVLGDRVA